MKVNINDLLFQLETLEKEFQLLNTVADIEVVWYSIPNSKLEIVKERLDLIKSTLNELFLIFNESMDEYK